MSEIGVPESEINPAPKPEVSLGVQEVIGYLQEEKIAPLEKLLTEEGKKSGGDVRFFYIPERIAKLRQILEDVKRGEFERVGDLIQHDVDSSMAIMVKNQDILDKHPLGSPQGELKYDRKFEELKKERERWESQLQKPLDTELRGLIVDRIEGISLEQNGTERGRLTAGIRDSQLKIKQLQELQAVVKPPPRPAGSLPPSAT